MIEVLLVVGLTYTVFQTLFFLNCLSSRRRDQRRLENVFRGSVRKFKTGKDKLDDDDAEDAGRATSVTCTGFKEKGSWPRLDTTEASNVVSTHAEPTMPVAAPHERQVTRLLVRGSRRSQRRAGLLDAAGNSLAHSVKVQNAIIIMDEEDDDKDHHYMSLKRTTNIYNNLEETHSHTVKKHHKNYNITVNSNTISVNGASKINQNRELNLDSIESCGDPTSMMTQVTDCDDQEARSNSSNNSSSACSRSNSASGNSDSAGLAVNCAKLLSRASRYSSLDELNEIQETRMDIDDLCSTEDELDAPDSSPSQMDMLSRLGSDIDLVSTISQILHSPPGSMQHGFDQPPFTSIESTASLYSGDDSETGTSRWAHIIPRQGPTTDAKPKNRRSSSSSTENSQTDVESIYGIPARLTELHNTPPEGKRFEMGQDKGLPIIPVEFNHHNNSKRLIKDLPGIHGSLPRRNPQNSLHRQKASSFYTLPRRRPSDKVGDDPPPPLPPRTLQRERRGSAGSSRSTVAFTDTGSYDPLYEDSTQEEEDPQSNLYTRLGLCEHGNVLCDCDGDNDSTDTLVNSHIHNNHISTNNENVYDNIYEINGLNTNKTKSDAFEKSEKRNRELSTNNSREVSVFKDSEPPGKSESDLVEGDSKHSKSGSCSGSSGYHDEEEESTASESQTESMSEDSGRGSPEKAEVHSSDESGSLASGEEHHYEDIDPAEMARLRRRDSEGRRKYGKQGSVRASQEEARQRRRLQGLDDLIAGVPPPDYDMSGSHLLTDVSARPDVRTSGPTSSIPPPPEFDNTKNSTQSSSKRQLQSTVSMPPSSTSSSSHQPLSRTTSAPGSAPPPPPPPMPSTPSPKYSPTSTHKSPSGGSSPDFNSNSSKSSHNDSEDTVKRRNTGSLRGHKKLDRPMSLPLNVAEHYDKMLMEGVKSDSDSNDGNYSPTKSRLAGGTNMNFIPPKFETNPEGGLIKPSEYLKSLGPRPAPSLPNLNLSNTNDYATNDTTDGSCSSANTLSPTACLPSIPESTEEEVGKVVIGAGAPPPPPAPPAPPMQSPFNTLKATINSNTTKRNNANNNKTMLPTISVSDLKSVQLKKTEVKSMKSLPLPIRPGMSVPAFADQKNDVIAELKISQDVGGVRKLKTERAKEEEKITRLETDELKKAFSPDNFVPKIPEKDNAGNHIPEWKRQMLGRRAAEKAKQETKEMLQKELEEKRLQAMPPWKRQLMARQGSDGNRDGLVTPRTQSPVRIALPTKHL